MCRRPQPARELGALDALVERVVALLDQLLELGGRQILLPRWFNVALLYDNRKIVDDAREPYPSPDWTWDDYIAAAKRLTRRDKDGDVEIWGSTVTTGWWGEWLIYVRQSGGDLFTDDVNKCLLDTPQAIAGMQFYYDKIYKHRISPRPGFGPDHGFMSGKIAMEFGGHTGSWIAYNQIASLDWDIQILPKGPVTRVGGEFALDSFGISKSSRCREQAWEFIKFLASKESGRMHVANGYLPVRKSIAAEMLASGKRLAHPRNIQAAYEQLKYARQVPRSPDYIELSLEVIQPDVDRMLDKQLDVSETCRSAARSANRFISVLGAKRRETSSSSASFAPQAPQARR